MVGTVMKHEYLRTRALVGVVFGVGVLVTLGGAVMILTRWPVISALGTLVAMMGAALPFGVVQLALGVDYWRNAYGPGGYLTQALPVRGSTQYGARLLWGFLVSLAGSVLTALLGTVVLLATYTARGQGASQLAAQVRTAWATAVAVIPPWLWVVGVLLVLVSIVKDVVVYYFAASVGSESRLNRLGAGGPVLVWVALYVVVQVLMVAGVLAIPVGLTEAGGQLVLVNESIVAAIASRSEPTAMPLGWVPAFLVTMAALVWRTRLSWERKVSLT